MDRRLYLVKFAALVMLAGVGAGCNSSGRTDAGGEPAREDQFVASEDQVGGIDLEVYTNPLAVGETSKFRVAVRDANGLPIPQVRISCDSEREIAIVEPTTGIELTDAWGHMSGVIGCVAPGSFQLACRLPIGANKRAFVTVVCTGSAPAGFEGWPGAAGGTLGGGVDTSDQAGSDGLNVRVTDISFNDGPNEDTTAIDVVFTPDCDGLPDTVDPEVFTDTIVEFTVVNDTNQFVRFTSYRYSVGNYDGAGNTFNSPSLNLIGEVPIPANGGEGTFSAVFIEATTGKRYYGASSAISSTGHGFKNVTFTLRGTDASGAPVEVRASTSISVGGFNNCQ